MYIHICRTCNGYPLPGTYHGEDVHEVLVDGFVFVRYVPWRGCPWGVGGRVCVCQVRTMARMSMRCWWTGLCLRRAAHRSTSSCSIVRMPSWMSVLQRCTAFDVSSCKICRKYEIIIEINNWSFIDSSVENNFFLLIYRPKFSKSKLA